MLEALCEELENCKIHFREILVPHAEVYSELAEYGTGQTGEAYYSLCSHLLLPDEIDRVLYLDAGDTTDENGNKVFTKNENLLLPPEKKAVVLSVDDLSYYHSYEAASYPDKLVLDENGDIKCHYIKPDGSEAVGDFDVVPRQIGRAHV